MSQYTDLIARLRGRAWFNRADLDIAQGAADALEALQADDAVKSEGFRKLWDDYLRLLAERDAIDARHQPDDESPPNCAHCSYKWPCPDHRILHPGETNE